MSEFLEPTREPLLINSTGAVHELPDGKAVCFGPAGSKTVSAGMARILAGFSGPARKNEVARLVLARRSLLSQASPDDRRLNSTLQSLLALYARLRRRMGGARRRGDSSWIDPTRRFRHRCGRLVPHHQPCLRVCVSNLQ